MHLTWHHAVHPVSSDGSLIHGSESETGALALQVHGDGLHPNHTKSRRSRVVVRAKFSGLRLLSPMCMVRTMSIDKAVSLGRSRYASTEDACVAETLSTNV